MNFSHIAQTIMKRLFRVYAHIYHEHFDRVDQLKAIPHLNTSFKHFILFVQEFNLIDEKQLAPLQDLIQKLTPAGSEMIASEINGDEPNTNASIL